MTEYLTVDLDNLYGDGYFYTEFDIGGAGHAITIKAKDKEKFLHAFAEEWKVRARNALEVDEMFEE